MLFAVAVYPLFLDAQTDTTVVPFVAYWWIADSYEFEITEIEEKWDQGELTERDSSSYVARFEVIDSSDVHYTIKWSRKADLTWDQIGLVGNPEFDKYLDMEVIYKTNELGEFVELVNWEELSELYLSLVDEVTQALIAEYPENKDFAENALEQLKVPYSSKEGIENLVWDEIGKIHILFGMEYPVDEVIEYEDSFPNLFGGDPIKANAELYVSEVDWEDEFCIIVQEIKVDPVGALFVIKDMFAKMNLPQAEFNAVLDEAVLDIQDINVMGFYYYPGVPLYEEFTREINMSLNGTEIRKVEITRLELLLD